MAVTLSDFRLIVLCFVQLETLTLAVQDWMGFHGYAGGEGTVAAITECTAHLARLEQDIGFGRRRPPVQPARSTGAQLKRAVILQPRPAGSVGNMGNMGGRSHLKRPGRARISDTHKEIIYMVSPWPVMFAEIKHDVSRCHYCWDVTSIMRQPRCVVAGSLQQDKHRSGSWPSGSMSLA